MGAAQRIVSMQEKASRGWGVGREGDETLLSPSSFSPPLRHAEVRKAFLFCDGLKIHINSKYQTHVHLTFISFYSN